MSDTTIPQGQFPWMSLPPELRDWALDHMIAATKPVKIKTPHLNYFRFHIHNAPDTDLLLVCRQFKKEYLARIQNRTTISFQDHRQCEFNVPHVFGHIAQFPLSSACLLAFRHNTFSDTGRHAEWLKRTLVQLKVPAMHIDLYCETDGDDDLHAWPVSSKQERLKAKLVELVAIDGITSLNLYWYNGTPDSFTLEAQPYSSDEIDEEVRKNVDDVLAGPQNLVETWTKANGWEFPFLPEGDQDPSSSKPDRAQACTSVCSGSVTSRVYYIRLA